MNTHRYIPYLIITMLLMAGCFGSGCNRHDSRLFPFGWKSEGEAVDSLLRELNAYLYNYGDTDSLTLMIEKYIKVSAINDKSGEYAHRRLYWEGSALFMQGNYEQGDSLRRQAIEICDSSRFPHDYLVYRFAVEEPTDFRDNKRKYERYISDLNTFIDFKDYANGFSRAVQLSQLMSEAGMHDRALGYALLADSLLKEADLPMLRLNNQVNIASCQFQSGDTVGAIATLVDFKEKTKNEINSSVAAIVNFNIYQMNGDTTALQMAWKTMQDHPELQRLYPLITAAMVKNLKKVEVRDSIYYPFLKMSDNYNYRAEELMYIKAAVCKLSSGSVGRETLSEAVKAYEKEVENYLNEEKRGELITTATAEDVRKSEQKIEQERQRSKRILWKLLAAGFVLFGAATIIIILHINRLRRIRLLTQLEIEQHRRKQLASDLLISEKEKLVESLQQKIDNLVTKEILNKSCAEDIVSTVVEPLSVGERRNGEKNSEDDRDCEIVRIEKKEKVYNEQEFLNKLIEKYPRIGKTGRKIAVYLWRGLDTSEIAREMNIRKESVIQARWRLRSQMGLPPEADLEVVIHRLMS